MSAPNTNLEKQEKRHAGPLIGITAGIAFVAIMVLGYVFFIATPADDTPDITPTDQAVPTDSPAPQINAPPSDAVVPATR